MNIVVSWILKFTRSATDQLTEDNHYKLKYEESDAFYILVHIMEVLQYRNVYDIYLSKLVKHLNLITTALECAFPEVYDKLIEQNDIDLTPIFTNTVASMFIADLQTVNPLIASHIFDVFLIDGEKVIFTLITKFIMLKEQKILELKDDDVLPYMRYHLPEECLKEHTMPELFDFDDMI